MTARLCHRVLAMGWVLLASTPALAHDRSVSYSSWRFDAAGATVQLRVRALDVDSLARGEVLSEVVTLQLQLWSKAGLCRPSPARAVTDTPGFQSLHWRLNCPTQAGARRIVSRLFMPQRSSHMHIAELNLPGTDSPLERLLVEGAREAMVPQSPAPASLLHSTWRFVPVGVTHMLTGWDHLLFVGLLVMTVGRLRSLLWMATGFTLGHSVTLALATLGLFEPHTPSVESLVALSIALLAVENVWLSQTRPGTLLPALTVLALLGLALAAPWLSGITGTSLLGLALFAGCCFALARRNPSEALGVRGGMACAFGLIHGFGFAAVLMETGLPAAQRGAALLGFNLGIEIAQLAFVTLLWWLLRHLQAHRIQLVSWSSAGAMLAASFWFCLRSVTG